MMTAIQKVHSWSLDDAPDARAHFLTAKNGFSSRVGCEDPQFRRYSCTVEFRVPGIAEQRSLSMAATSQSGAGAPGEGDTSAEKLLGDSPAVGNLQSSSSQLVGEREQDPHSRSLRHQSRSRASNSVHKSPRASERHGSPSSTVSSPGGESGSPGAGDHAGHSQMSPGGSLTAMAGLSLDASDSFASLQEPSILTGYHLFF